MSGNRQVIRRRKGTAVRTGIECVSASSLAIMSGGSVQSGAPRLSSSCTSRALLHWLIAETGVVTSSGSSSMFAGFRFPREVISVAVRWYLRYGLSYRDVEELLAERGITVDHVTVYRWVQRFTPEFGMCAAATTTSPPTSTTTTSSGRSSTTSH